MKIEIGDTVRIIESRQFSHDHLEGATRVVRDTIRRYKNRPARVSVLLDETAETIGHGGLIIDLDVEQVEKVERFPQQGDRVEARSLHAFGEVKLANTDGDDSTFEFFVRLDDGFGGWFSAPELRVCGGAPASDPALYR